MLDADVAIVGGSVAGAATAAFLARRGHRVIVLDRARFPRDKPCGEGLMPHGVDVLRDLGVLGRLRDAGAGELHGVRYSLGNGETVAATFPRLPGRSSVALGIRRVALDTLLLDHARGYENAAVIEGYRVREVLRDGGGVAGVTDGQWPLRTRVVVGADGLRSRVRAGLGWDASRSWPRRWAVTGHFRLPVGHDLPPEVLVVLAPGVEAYLTPLGGGEALVALLGGRSLMVGLKGCLQGGYERAVRAFAPLAGPLEDAELLPGVRATGPFAGRASRVAGGAALLVGDAAGFLDPITGEGMAAALLQARAAARVIDRALTTTTRGEPLDLSPYAAAHRRIVSTGTLLTWLALGLCAFPHMTARAMRGLQGRPGLFGKLLAINCGHAGLGAITPREWAALASGW